MKKPGNGKCLPCSTGTPPLTSEEINAGMKKIDGEWKLGNNKIIRRYSFKNFAEALSFTLGVGELSEREGHHPEILIGWGKVEITLWTHKVNGLTTNDFIMAAMFDHEYLQKSERAK